MGVDYKPVIWNRNKYIYDCVLLVAAFAYIYLYMRVGPMFQDLSRPVEVPIMRMRAFGSCAFLMLSVILCIGPLARLDERFLPLLYNRRHFGVLTACIATVHASHVLAWYYAFSPTDPYVALLSSNVSFGQVLGFPFEIFGIFALLVLLALAFTSHDFWLSFLTPPIWKRLHMAVYFAYGAVVLHIALGPLQSGRDPVFSVVVGMCVLMVCTLHFMTARKNLLDERAGALGEPNGKTPWIPVCKAADIEDKRAITVTVGEDEKVAIFRNGDTLSAVSNVCAHQNGPLGEGKIVAGCITCPWHGFQYRPQDGRSPPPFEEKISTYRLKMRGETILLDPRALPPGTYVEPLAFGRRA